MIKAVQALGIAILATFSLTGCELYFGNSDGGGGTGSGGPPGGGSGFSCQSNADCAAGCFCKDGTCEEGGFCSTNDDCPAGQHCDARSSCVPNTCDDQTPCAAGQECQNGECVSTCTCGSDQQAQQQGFDWCDETTSTCHTGSDPSGGCLGEVTCNTKAPDCGEHEVPLIKDGCYTGECRAVAQCEGAPACSAFQHEDDCTAPGDCTPVYTGHDCKDPQGNTCTAGSMNCTCATFTFASCQ